MSLLTVIISTASILFIIIGRDAYKRSTINLIHGLIFILGSLFVAYGLRQPQFLDKVSKVFGLARGADILIYGSIITLVYFYFELVHQRTKDNYQFTKLVTNEALSHVDPEYINTRIASIQRLTPKHQLDKSDFMFHVKGLNESATIGKVIDEIIGAGFSKILIVNDGSTDAMPDIVKDKMKQYPNKLIVLVNHLVNRRHGGGNKTGIAFFKKFGALCDIKYVVFFDADDQMDIKDMSTYMDYLIQHPDTDVIQGSRFVMGGGAKNMPFMRKMILLGGKVLTRVMNGMRITDSHNGYKCFRLQALQQINLTTDTTAYANELLDEYGRLGLSVVELPVHIKYTEYSLHKGQQNKNAINILLELIYRKFFYR